jgi:hypothetical protein
VPLAFPPVLPSYLSNPHRFCFSGDVEGVFSGWFWVVVFWSVRFPFSVSFAFGDLFFAPLFLLVSPAERDDFAFCAPFVFCFFLFTASRELFIFCAPFFTCFSRRAGRFCFLRPFCVLFLPFHGEP